MSRRPASARLRPRPALFLAAVVLLLALAAAAYATRQAGGSPDGAASPTPTLRPGGDDPKGNLGQPTPTPSGEPTPTPPSGMTLLFAEFGPTADTLVVARAGNPEERAPVATVEHAPGWGVKGSLSPDGTRIALNVMTGRASDPDTEAQLQVLPTAGGAPRTLLQGLALRWTPIWLKDGSGVIVRRNEVTRDPNLGPLVSAVELVLVNAADGTARALLRLAGGGDVFPIGLSPDGTHLYYAALVGGGTEVNRLRLADGAVERAVSLPALTRDWQLSPDGRSLCYLALEASGRYRAYVVDLERGAPRAVLDSDRDNFSPVWTPDGFGITIGLPPAGGRRGAMVAPRDGGEARALAGAGSGFDVPVAWSPDGRFLLVRHFTGSSAEDPGREETVLLEGDTRRPLAPGPVEFLGWLERTSSSP
ncbi:MAG TPA: hypothetical protein VIO14_13185 [Dehalococcoidia bacterium]